MYVQFHEFSIKIIWTLLKPERTQNPERSQNVLQLRSVLKPERTFFEGRMKKVRSVLKPERC